MSTSFQVCIDAAEPHAVNAFWAAALGYTVELHEPFIRQLLDAGVATDDDVATIDGRLVWRTAAACADPDGRGPRVLVQHVPEAKSVKNRVHLDLRIGEEGREAEVARLVALGATKLWDGRQGPQTWVTMADPEGNEFCVS